MKYLSITKFLKKFFITRKTLVLRLCFVGRSLNAIWNVSGFWRELFAVQK